MSGEPYSLVEARQRIRRILDDDNLVITTHFIEELDNDGLKMGDALNILKGGFVKQVDFQSNAWRYRVSTPRMTVVVEFEGETKLVLVTVWREKEKRR